MAGLNLPISVCIPCYKQEQWLQGAIDSAHTQTDNVNRCGDDDIFRCGVCYNRNFLIIYSMYDLILCLDADDRLFPDGLERLYAAYKPGTWVYGGWQEIDENEAILGDYEAPPPGMINRKNLCYSTFLFHKDDWRKVGGFDPDFEIGCEDYCFQVALTNAGIKPVRIEGQVYQRMIHENGRTARAKALFPVLQGLIKEKYPAVFG